jgi:TPP-dependent trihydroxycyclohexane-1,2-dione (THcHDO) dehydratase
MTFGNPDFVVYAQAYGAKGTRVGSVDELRPALEAAFAGGASISWSYPSTIPKTSACWSMNCDRGCPVVQPAASPVT